MALSRPALIVLLGLGSVALVSPCPAQTLPRAGLSGSEVGMDFSARPLRGGGAGRPEADAVIRAPKGIGRSRTLVLGTPEDIERPVAETGEGGWPVDLRRFAPPRSAAAEP
ncbi:hypothetical protein [Methylobacterium sp. Leaf456]|uniref:hypothetical protein n=1 Tax=Methylobacterium sp. Leaf456 TaxID=1736382 RepID=UPI000AC9F344|nr:hypothetical protein [Methylobacterium sp. Leaf456]